MATKLVYIGPFADGVEISETGQWLAPGEATEVDDEVAGRAPDGDDPGAGLLAQVANFAEAKPAKARKSVNQEESNG